MKLKKSSPAYLVLGLLISGACLYFSFSKIDVSELRGALEKTKVSWLGLSLLLAVAHNFIGAYKWQLLLQHSGKVSFWEAFWNLRLSYFFNATLPAKMGEFFRIYHIQKKTDLSTAHALGTMGADRFLDFLSLVSLITIGSLVLGLRNSYSYLYVSIGLTSLAFLVFVVLHWLPRRVPSLFWNSIVQFIQSLKHGLSSLYKPQIFWKTLTLAYCGWLLQAGMLVSLSYAVGEPLSIFKSFFVIGALNLAILLPAAPANIGNFELAVISTLSLLFFWDKESAAAVAILYHLIQLVPTWTWGVVALQRRRSRDSNIR